MFPFQHQSSTTITRRAVTPGPDWGRYNSDEDEPDKGKLEISHNRQPSYLVAMDGEECTCGIGSHPDASGPPTDHHHHKYPDASAPPTDHHHHKHHSGSRDEVDYGRYNGSYGNQQQYPKPCGQYVSHGKIKQGQVDLLGSIPGHLNSRPNPAPAHKTMYNQQPQHQQQHQQQHQSQPQHDGYDWTLSGCNQYRRPSAPNTNFVYPNPPTSQPSCVAKVNEIQKMDTKTVPHPQSKADVVRYQLGNEPPNTQVNRYAMDNQNGYLTASGVPYQQSGCPYPESNLKRTKSVENTIGGQSEPSKSRPQSARPSDYPYGKPTVIPHHASNGLAPSDAPKHPNPQPPRRSKMNEWLTDDDDNYGTYISKKSVESVMSKLQKGAAQKPTPSHAPTSSTSLLKDALKVDIPDNASIGSQKDSGYRSGGSSGDRNSASSASSTSMESPTVDTCKGYLTSCKNGMFDDRSHNMGAVSASNCVTVRSAMQPPLPLGGIPEQPANLGFKGDVRSSSSGVASQGGEQQGHKSGELFILKKTHIPSQVTVVSQVTVKDFRVTLFTCILYMYI